jgi:hypothetical protein
VSRQHHQVTYRKQGIHASGSVGDNQCLNAHRRHDMHGQHQRARRVPFVKMAPSIHDQQGDPVQFSTQVSPVMTQSRTLWKRRDRAIVNGFVDLHTFDEAMQPGPQNQPELWRHGPTAAHDFDAGVNRSSMFGPYGRGHDITSTAGFL